MLTLPIYLIVATFLFLSLLRSFTCSLRMSEKKLVHVPCHMCFAESYESMNAIKNKLHFLKHHLQFPTAADQPSYVKLSVRFSCVQLLRISKMGHFYGKLY